MSTRVLMIGAHPDDEDTQLITWLAKGRHVETAYLSLTRGDGGQNLLGNELGEALGAIRTEELLAARRIDGGRQYFTRAFDFGFSKSADETFRQWPHDSVLRDVITIVRAFRPHVITAVFSGTPLDGHGHHQASGILAREAYELAGDTVRFPRSATSGLGPWTVLKFYRKPRGDSATIRMNVGEYDPLLGRSYAELSGESRSQHKSQAFGALELKGVRWFELKRMATRAPAPEDPKKEQSIFDGIDTTWGRFRGLMSSVAARAALDSLPAAFRAAKAAFSAMAPERSVTALTRIARLLDQLCPQPPNVDAENDCYGSGLKPDLRVLRATHDLNLSGARSVARQRVNDALLLATGVAVEATADRTVWAKDEPIPGRIVIYNRGRVQVRLAAYSLQSDASFTTVDFSGEGVVIRPDSSLTLRGQAETNQVSQPWWLASSRRGSMFSVSVTGIAESGRAGPSCIARIVVEGTEVQVLVPITYRHADALRGELNDPTAIAPAIAVLLDEEVQYARANTFFERAISVHVTSAASASRDVDVTLRLPSGLVADTTTRHITLRSAGASATATFTVRGRLAPGRHALQAIATSGGQTFEQGYVTVDYPHIRTQRLYRPSRLELEAVDVALPVAAKIGYIAGVGDNSAPMLEQLGLEVTPLDPAMLPRTDLKAYTAIVVGPRAYEANATLVANNARLLDYAQGGGTLMVQYGQYEMMQPGIMPYPITINRPHDRVTIENAPVRIVDSTSVVLRAPNRITSSDFDGWVQDRSLYMPRTFDQRYQPVIELNDPGEQPNRGGILVAPYGKGTYVYTTLAFFRQLPNGVPGAARLFVNLLAAKAGRTVQ